MKLRRMGLIPEIPTSSMADIAFLLIVFFMLTTVFSANKGMTHILPADSVPNPAANSAIYIRIFSRGDFLMGGTPYSLAQVDRVSEYLLGKFKANRQHPVILETDLEAAYGQMVGVFDEIKLAEKVMKDYDPKFVLDLTLPNKFERNLYRQMSH